MSQIDEIIKHLKVNKTMTQSDLSQALYGDRKHLPNLYSALMKLVNCNVIKRNGSHPAYYSLSVNDSASICNIYDVKDKSLKNTKTIGNVLLLNKPFLGGWLDKKGNIGHEIIDFLLTDDNNYYVYNNPWGICRDDIWIEDTQTLNRNSKEKYVAKYMLLTSGEKIGQFGNELEILYVIELREKLHRFHTGNSVLRKNQKDIINNIIIKNNIKYNGKYLHEVYGNDDSLYLTFKASKIYKADPPIKISGLKYDFRRNKGYLYSDRNKDDYYKINDLIDTSINSGRLVKYAPKNVSPLTIGSLNSNKTFLDLIGLPTDEQVFTNMLFSVLSQGELFKHFCANFKGKKVFSINDSFVVHRETSIVNGRMDICAESNNQRIIIENKVYSGLNGVKPADNTTQLSTYYRWGKDGKKIEPLCFVVAPNFRVSEIEDEIKQKDNKMIGIFQIVTFGDVAEFIETEYNGGHIRTTYAYYNLIPQIINCFKNLSYSTKEDLYARMFLNATN